MPSSLPPWVWITEPRYLKFSTCFRAFPVLSLICRVSAVLAHTIVSVSSAFTLRPLLSKASCHSPNLFWRLVDEISDKIRSSAYSMSHGTSCRTYSLTIINSNGLRQDPWCTPTFISNASVFPRPLLTVVTAPSYIDLITLTSFSLIPFRLRHLSGHSVKSFLQIHKCPVSFSIPVQDLLRSEMFKYFQPLIASVSTTHYTQELLSVSE